MKFEYNDGGREAAGYKGYASDCVVRSIAIISGKPYQEVYDALAEGNATQRITKYSTGSEGKLTANHGISTKRKWFQQYMTSLGFKWVPTMMIGSGCKVHLREDELPKGRLVVSVSKHMTAVIDGVLHDNHDCTRAGTRCVYGYYIFEKDFLTNSNIKTTIMTTTTAPAEVVKDKAGKGSFIALSKEDRDKAVKLVLQYNPKFDTKQVRDKLVEKGYTDVDYHKVRQSVKPAASKPAKKKKG